MSQTLPFSSYLITSIYMKNYFYLVSTPYSIFVFVTVIIGGVLKTEPIIYWFSACFEQFDSIKTFSSSELSSYSDSVSSGSLFYVSFYCIELYAISPSPQTVPIIS